MKRPTLIANTFIAITLISGSIGSICQAQDWPQWGGVNREGRAAGFDVPKNWPKELTQKWKVTVGDGVATPSLVGDKLYVFSRQEGSEVLRCLDAGTGKELWQNKYEALGASGPASGFSGPRASPTIVNGKMVTLGVRGVLSCYDAPKSTLLWRQDDFKGYPRFFTSASPLIVDDVCVAQLGGPDNGGIAAYTLADGKEKWKWIGDGPAYASPVLMSAGNTKLVVALTETKVVAVNLADGKLMWETPFAVQGRGYNAATPIVKDQTIIYAGAGRSVTAVTLEKAGDKFTAKELWKNPDQSVMFNTPVLKNNLLFGLTAGNEFFCINATDGKTAWTAPLNPAAASSEPQEESDRGRGGRGRGRGGYGSIVDAGSVLSRINPKFRIDCLSTQRQVLFGSGPNQSGGDADLRLSGAIRKTNLHQRSG